MKMRKTVYPIAIIIALPLVLVVFIVLNQGHFIQMEHEQFIKKLKNGTDEEIMANFEWKGFGNPKIHSINLSEKSSTLRINNYERNRNAKDSEPDLSIYFQAGQQQDPKENIPIIIIRYKTFGIVKEQPIELID